ncbi:MAG: hypothetical protein E5Y52_11410 [Mesorhizobium sp.]|nr:MAG: hypothetical protein E5Y52_11410 [Mesorhizobium sp.]
MHSRMTWNAELLAFVAFDLLYLNGEHIRALPLIERKARLWDLIKPAKGIIQYSDHTRATALPSSRPLRRWVSRPWCRNGAPAAIAVASKISG